MPQTSIATPGTCAQRRALLVLLLVVPVLAALAAVWALDHSKTHRSLLAATNLVGPTTRSLLEGNGLTFCTEDMGTPGNPICFHAARMPATAATVALGMTIFGDRYLAVALFKTLLFLLPVELAVFLVWQRLPASKWGSFAVAALLLAPFAMVPFLADVSNILVDEGYSYSMLALAAALLFFPQAESERPPGRGSRAFLFACAADGLYLSKSGMLPAVLVLLAGFLVLERDVRLRLLVLIAVAASPLGWGLHQYHASGRFSVGTSLDGINLHKGNNDGFLANYPPREGDSLDWYDAALSRGLHFEDEWSFNDFHQRAALEYLRAHPGRTLRGDLRKLQVLFLAVHKVGSTASRGAAKIFENAGLVVFRIIFWAAILASVRLLFHPAWRLRYNAELVAGRFYPAIFLAIIAACTIPYVAGFAYTRHVSILIYPSVLFCSHLLCNCIPASPTTVATAGWSNARK